MRIVFCLKFLLSSSYFLLRAFTLDLSFAYLIDLAFAYWTLLPLTTPSRTLDIVIMDKNYGSWSLIDLKSELKRRNAKATGKKAVLVQRLEDYDKLFGPIAYESTNSVFKINLPDPDCFRDVTSDSQMPALDNTDLMAFCQLIERKDTETSSNMYEENFLISCRSAIKDGDYFVTGSCASEMRKHVTYTVTMRLKDHLILETQCECAAGVGPHSQCKHVLVLFNAIVDYNKSKRIKLKTSITNKLQTFHQPRAGYSGNPVLAENLNLTLKDKKIKDIISFDPRKNIQDEKQYKENFNKNIANYSGPKANMPIKQILLPADKRSIFMDHDYLKKNSVVSFLNLNSEELKEVERKTMSCKKMWLDQRRRRLQSSEFGKICKQKTNKKNLAKTLLQINNINTPAIRHGRKYEPEGIKKFEEVTGLTVSKCGIIVHPQDQFLGSTPDGLINDNAVLEVKCPYTAFNKMISGDSVPYLYLCEKSGDLKLNETHDYFYQIQGQMYCTQRSVAYFFIYTGCDYYLSKITRDETFIQEMRGKLKDFYENFFKQALLNRFLYDKRNYD